VALIATAVYSGLGHLWTRPRRMTSRIDTTPILSGHRPAFLGACQPTGELRNLRDILATIEFFEP